MNQLKPALQNIQQAHTSFTNTLNSLDPTKTLLLNDPRIQTMLADARRIETILSAYQQGAVTQWTDQNQSTTPLFG